MERTGLRWQNVAVENVLVSIKYPAITPLGLMDSPVVPPEISPPPGAWNVEMWPPGERMNPGVA